MEPEQVFLTDTRRTALNNYDSSNSNHRTHKSRTTARAKVALEELIWVAECNEIDNADVFDAATVRHFLEALLGDADEIEPYWKAWDEGREAIEQHEEEYRYERRLIQSISTVTTLYEDRLLAQRKPQYLEDTEPGASKITDSDK